MSSPWGYLPRWAWALLGVLLLGLAVYALREALTPIFFAFLIAYFLDPVVDRFESRGVPRAAGIVIVLALTLLGVALVLLLIVPAVVREGVAFAHELPAKVDALRRTIEPWLAQHGVAVPHSFDELRRLVSPEGQDASGPLPSGEIASRAASVLRTAGGWIWGGTSSALATLGTAFLVPVFAFYLLHDFDRMTAGIRELVPWRYRPFVVDVAQEVDQVLGQFVRGQLLVMLILAVLYSVAYSIVGIRLAIPIGIVAGLLSFIPYVGGASALVLALLMCALGWQGWWQVIGVGIAYGVIQILEGFVITPRIVGDKVGLPAIWVLVALVLAGEVLGFLGVLLAVPLAAITKIFVVRALAYYKKTPLFREGAPPEEAAPVLRGWLAEEGLPDAPEMAEKKHEALAETLDEVPARGEGEDERGHEHEDEHEHEHEDERGHEDEDEHGDGDGDERGHERGHEDERKHEHERGHEHEHEHEHEDEHEDAREGDGDER